MGPPVARSSPPPAIRKGSGSMATQQIAGELGRKQRVDRQRTPSWEIRIHENPREADPGCTAEPGISPDRRVGMHKLSRKSCVLKEPYPFANRPRARCSRMVPTPRRPPGGKPSSHEGRAPLHRSSRGLRAPASPDVKVSTDQRRSSEHPPEIASPAVRPMAVDGPRSRDADVTLSRPPRYRRRHAALRSVAGPSGVNPQRPAPPTPTPG
jgi:hypothetical protein